MKPDKMEPEYCDPRCKDLVIFGEVIRYHSKECEVVEPKRKKATKPAKEPSRG